MDPVVSKSSDRGLKIILVLVIKCDWLWEKDIFAHIFKIELLAPQGRVSSQL